jgi:hypothetical protein
MSWTASLLKYFRLSSYWFLDMSDLKSEAQVPS